MLSFSGQFKSASGLEILERGKKEMDGIERTHVISGQDEDQSMPEVRIY